MTIIMQHNTKTTKMFLLRNLLLKKERLRLPISIILPKANNRNPATIKYMNPNNMVATLM